MNRPDVEKTAAELHAAASELLEAVRAGDAERTEIAMQARTAIFDALHEATQRAGLPLGTTAERIVREVLEMDREVEAALQDRLGELRADLDQIAHARRVASRQHVQASIPRFVSRRA